MKFSDIPLMLREGIAMRLHLKNPSPVDPSRMTADELDDYLTSQGIKPEDIQQSKPRQSISGKDYEALAEYVWANARATERASWSDFEGPDSWVLEDFEDWFTSRGIVGADAIMQALAKDRTASSPVTLAPAAAVSSKLTPRHFARDNQLWTEWTDATGAKMTKPAADRVTWEGKQVASSVLLRFLLTGEWSRKGGLAKPHQAIVWHKGQSKYVGRFATAEEAEAAKFAFKMGIFQ
jgi:hypothetical protein